MPKMKHLAAAVILSLRSVAGGQSLAEAEVRLPYAELKQLLSRTKPEIKPASPEPALLSAHLRLSIENGRPVLDATFRTLCFGDETARIPLLAGDVSLGGQEPPEAAVVIDGKALCLVVEGAGVRSIQLRLLPIVRADAFVLALPACPAVIFETGELGPERSVVLASDGHEETLAAGETRPLANSAQSLRIRLLDGAQTREALRPPQPSEWSWQQQALVIAEEGELVYHIIARASAADGSGVAAALPIPTEARDLVISGEDLVSHEKIRRENPASSVALVWKTRGVLDRQLMISYRMPLRPLDRVWRLQAPGGDGTRTRFVLASSPLLGYAAEGLSVPLTPQGLPAALAARLGGATCRYLEAATTAELSVTPLPVAATAEAVMSTAEWLLKIEPDGAMLATGVLGIDHKSTLEFTFDTPAGMKLLSCELGGKPVPPVDLGQGLLKVTLPAGAGKSDLVCSFTGRGDALDPVEGTLRLSLPRIPMFIHKLVWHVDLPAGYQAETHGNLTRVQGPSGGPPSRVTLNKNLCRDEGPEIHVFYQRSDLNR